MDGCTKDDKPLRPEGDNMTLGRKFIQYSLAFQLVKEKSYDILYVSDSNNGEIWLKKEVDRKNISVIRIAVNGFHWKNHLKNDVMSVFQKVQTIKKMFKRKNINISNIYIATHSPVDDWEILKKPMHLKDKYPIQMNVFYLDPTNKLTELERLTSVLQIKPVTFDEIPNEAEQLQQVQEMQHTFVSLVQNKIDAEKKVFSYGKLYLTYLLIAMNVIVFLIMTFNGGTTNTENLIAFGAKFNPAMIMDGEWWRIVTSMFIHIGFLHLFMNMLALYYLGNVIERIYGSTRFMIIYFLGGIGGGLSSFAFTTNVSAGASGAIFGLFGAILFFGLFYKTLFFKTMGYNILFLIGFNVLIGFTVPMIDNAAHLGGLLGGFIASAIVHLPYKKSWVIRLGSIIVYFVLFTGLTFYGISTNVNSVSYQWIYTQELLESEEYEQVVVQATKGLENAEDLEAPLLFQRSYAYIKLNNNELALDDLEKVVMLDPDMAEAHYNLAILYIEIGEQEKAEDAIKKAYQLDSEHESIHELYNQMIK